MVFGSRLSRLLCMPGGKPSSSSADSDAENSPSSPTTTDPQLDAKAPAPAGTPCVGRRAPPGIETTGGNSSVDVLGHSRGPSSLGPLRPFSAPSWCCPSSETPVSSSMYTRATHIFDDKMTRMRREAMLETLARNDSYVSDLCKAMVFVDECSRTRLLALSPVRNRAAHQRLRELVEALQTLIASHERFGENLRASVRLQSWADPDSTSPWDAIAALVAGPASEAYAAYVSEYASTVELVVELRRDSRAFGKLCSDFARRNNEQTPESFIIKPVQRLPQLGCTLGTFLANTPVGATRGHVVAEHGLAAFTSWTASINRVTTPVMVRARKQE
eukprot:m51a1_g14469 hypothetical protein (331) ;mRNA; f:674778-676202